MDDLRYIHIKDYDELVSVVESDVLEMLEVLIDDCLDEYVEIRDFNLSGSYLRGDNRPDSDLDFDLYYIGDIDEDDFFNWLSGQLEYHGIRVDINPHLIEDEYNFE